MWPRRTPALVLVLVACLLCSTSPTQAGLQTPRALREQQGLAHGRLPATRRHGHRNALATSQGRQQQGLAQRMASPRPGHGQRRAFGMPRRRNKGPGLLDSAGGAGQGRARGGIHTGQGQKYGRAGKFTGQRRAFGIPQRHVQGLGRNQLNAAGGSGHGQARDGIHLRHALGLAQKQGLPGEFTAEQWADAEALLAFKLANRARGSVLEGWVMSPVASNAAAEPPWCSWNGIECYSAALRVTGIELASKFQPRDNCTQSIPPELGNMTALLRIDLSNNSLCGSLPSSLKGWAQVKIIQLSENNLEGPLSPDFKQWAALEMLDLSLNSFSGRLPSTLGQLTGLNSLDVRYNSFSGPVPSTVGQLTGLDSLYLSWNNFSGPLPSTLGQLTGVVSFFLSRNRFSGPLPSTLGQLRGLIELDMSYNTFSGPLPSTLGLLTLLTWLDLSNNAFHLSAGQNRSRTSFFEALCQMPLVSLGLSGNFYGGPVPACLGGLGRLEALGLARLNLTGEVHTLTQLNALTRLTALDLSGNNLGGTFPEAIGHMPSLVGLDLRSNPIEGTIPDVFGALLSLTFLNLGSTRLAGSLPSSLGLLSLEALELPDTLPCPEVSQERQCPFAILGGLFCGHCASYCSTCPPFPQSEAMEAVLKYEGVSSIRDMTGVQLSSNGSVESIQLVVTRLGTEPTSWWDCDVECTVDGKLVFRGFDVLAPLNRTLRSFSLVPTHEATDIRQLLPDSIALFTNLVELRLRNLLTGGIPGFLSALNHLTLLDLSDQKFSGGISIIQRLSSLRSLNLGKNQLDGSFPTTFRFPANLASVDLSANQFHGPFPQSLTALTGLTVLALDQNMFAGDLPPGLASLPLVYFAYDSTYLNCPNLAVRPPRQVNPSSAFCQRACPNYCKKYAPPPSPFPPPLSPPPPNPPPSPPPMQGVLQPWTIGVIAGAAVVVAGTAVAVVLLLRKSWREAQDSMDDVEKRSMRRFTFKELEEATRRFSNPIGGSDAQGVQAFFGSLPSGKQVVVKCRVFSSWWHLTPALKKRARDQAEDFRRQIKLLSSAHHRHLIALLGYCLHKGRLYLVEELAQRGSLSSILRSDPASLTWEHRLAIALGAAQGLDYLHSQIHPPILHGHIQSSAIFITEALAAKLGGLGTANIEGQERSVQELSATGYLDPERLASGENTAASDVYSLGVVLAELATGWQAMQNGQHILDRILKATSQGSTQSIIAETLQPELQRGSQDSPPESVSEEEGLRREGQLTLQCFAAFVALAMRCCSREPSRRPTAHHVARKLEEMLEGITGKVSMPSLADAGEGTVPFPWYHEPHIIRTEEDMFGSLIFSTHTLRLGSSSKTSTASGSQGLG